MKTLQNAIEFAMQEARFQRRELLNIEKGETFNTEAYTMLTKVIDKLTAALEEITPF